MVQFQEISDGLVLLLGKLDHEPPRPRRRTRSVYPQGEAAQVPGGVRPPSERGGAARWRRECRHDWWWGVEAEAIENLMEGDEDGGLNKNVNGKKLSNYMNCYASVLRSFCVAFTKR